MENKPEAMFRMSMGIMNGESRPGPLFSRTLCCSSVVAKPPMPEPMNTPISSRLTFSRSSPESINAWCPALTPNWVNRSARRASLGEGNELAPLKSFTSAAIWVSNNEASNWVIRSTPHLLASRLVQRVWMSLPKGLTTPRPVTTTLRFVQLPAIKIKGQPGLTSAEAAPESSNFLLGPNFFDILNHISDTLQLFRFFIGDFVPKFLFQSHYQLDRVQRVGPQSSMNLASGVTWSAFTPSCSTIMSFTRCSVDFSAAMGYSVFCFCLSMPRS